MQRKINQISLFEEYIAFLGLNTTAWVAQATEIYLLTVLEPRSLRSSYQQGGCLGRLCPGVDSYLWPCAHMTSAFVLRGEQAP